MSNSVECSLLYLAVQPGYKSLLSYQNRNINHIKGKQYIFCSFYLVIDMNENEAKLMNREENFVPDVISQANTNLVWS